MGAVATEMATRVRREGAQVFWVLPTVDVDSNSHGKNRRSNNGAISGEQELEDEEEDEYGGVGGVWQDDDDDDDDDSEDSDSSDDEEEFEAVDFAESWDEESREEDDEDEDEDGVFLEESPAVRSSVVDRFAYLQRHPAFLGAQGGGESGAEGAVRVGMVHENHWLAKIRKAFSI